MENGIFYRVQKDDSIERICKILQTDINCILSFNDIDINCLEYGDIIYLPYINCKVHIVMPLETFASIAKKYGVSEKDLKSKNNVDNLFVGQKIMI